MRILPALLCLGLSTGCSFTSKSPLPESGPERVEALIDHAIRQNDVPAISVVMVSDGELTYVHRGTLSRTSTHPVDQRTLFQIASLSKTFVGLVANRLILDDRLNPDDSITAYLPTSLTSETIDKLRPITVRHLIQHRSGLPRDTTRTGRRDGDPVDYDYTAADFAADLEAMPVKGRPGTSFEYSNFGYALLAYIIERAAGRPFDMLLGEVLTTHGLGDTTFTLDAEQRTRLAIAYRKDDRDRSTPPWVMGKLAPPTALFSSTEDLGRLLVAQLEAYRTRDSAGALLLTQSTAPAWDGTGIAYGCGLFDWGNGGFGHGGDMDGYASDYWFNPGADAGIAILTSSGGSWLQPLMIELSETLTRPAAGSQ